MKAAREQDIVASRCRARLVRLMRHAARHVTDENIPIEKRVHEVRRAAKEGRALFKLASPLGREESHNQRALLRDVRREFGAARESRVALSLIAEREKAGTTNDPALRSARRKLERRCHTQEAALTPERLARTAEQLTEIVHSLEQWPVGPNSDMAIFAQATKCYKQTRRLMPERDEPSLEALHAFRSAVIDHHHQMSLLAERDAQEANRRVEQLQQLRASLGDYLDRSALEAILNHDQDPRARHADGGVEGQMDVFLQKTMHAAHTLFREKPRNFAVHFN